MLPSRDYEREFQRFVAGWDWELLFMEEEDEEVKF